MHTDFMTSHIFFNQYSRSLNNARTDYEEGGMDVFAVEKVKHILS